ncbi:fatty acyl-CoA reductase wat-like [Drosophila subpulchrella]|uniref:fatty acyl-CoA reductase wat-like n=1 Tax=Drosophila subpulchrella TaxID=1486046 RepID=UPI0018A16E39|nr:fatty acyl-CoA reductase wat-like [Drosophila subpulchrella]
MSSEILRFYKDKTVFLTGGTGLLGKVIIEKLLRSTDVKRIYILVRPKRGENVIGRFEAWKKDQVFEVLLKNKPHALEHVTPISGDCCAPDMAISEADRRILTTEVQVVMHGAASVRFIEPLQQALNINTRAVRLMVQLAKEMQRLEAFVHVSTAFSNCVVNQIQERFYPENLTCPVDKVLDLSDSLGGEMVEKIAPALLGKFPNTYTYTKALGEQVIQEEAKDLPVGIFRPAIITSTFKEPVRGWIDGLQGLIALVYGTAYGIIHLVLVNLKVNVPLVPADYCVNVAIATAVQIAKISKQNKKCAIPIYAFSSCQSNTLTYGDLSEKCFQNGLHMPVEKMIWYPFNHNIACPYIYDIGAFFYHFLPGFLIDIALRLKGLKPMMVERYRRIDEGMKSLFPFTSRNFLIETNNTDQLWQSMSPEEKKMFHFDMSTIDWNEYFTSVILGIRLYLFKDPPTPESFAKGKKILSRFYVLDTILKFVIILVAGALAWFLFNLAFN